MIITAQILSFLLLCFHSHYISCLSCDLCCNEFAILVKPPSKASVHQLNIHWHQRFVWLSLVFLCECYHFPNDAQTQTHYAPARNSVHTIDPLGSLGVRSLLQISLPFTSHREKIHLCVMLRIFSIFFHAFVFQEQLFLMGYRTQPAYVNKPGEKAWDAKGESLLPYFTWGAIV